MRFKILQLAIISSVCVISLGCGKQSPAVSGRITSSGEPVAKLRVVLSPKQTKNTANVGPYSTGVTDENGNFTLRTRYDEAGAVVGTHLVGFEWSDIRFDAISTLRDALSEVESADAKAEIKAKIEEIKNTLASRPRLNLNLQAEFTVTETGSTEANFELTEISLR